jgi:hypothetical protein
MKKFLSVKRALIVFLISLMSMVNLIIQRYTDTNKYISITLTFYLSYVILYYLEEETW